MTIFPGAVVACSCSFIHDGRLRRSAHAEAVGQAAGHGSKPENAWTQGVRVRVHACACACVCVCMRVRVHVRVHVVHCGCAAREDREGHRRGGCGSSGDLPRDLRALLRTSRKVEQGGGGGDQNGHRHGVCQRHPRVPPPPRLPLEGNERRWSGV